MNEKKTRKAQTLHLHTCICLQATSPDTYILHTAPCQDQPPTEHTEKPPTHKKARSKYIQETIFSPPEARNSTLYIYRSRDEPKSVLVTRCSTHLSPSPLPPPLYPPQHNATQPSTIAPGPRLRPKGNRRSDFPAHPCHAPGGAPEPSPRRNLPRTRDRIPCSRRPRPLNRCRRYIHSRPA
jgi:hypothetical protein